MRPSAALLIILLVISAVHSFLYLHERNLEKEYRQNSEMVLIAASGLGLTDLCVSTEARYTRHPAVSDPISPFMDHPGAIEHFPSGSFWTPPELRFADKP